MSALATDLGRKTPARLAGSAILACQSDERLVQLVRDGHERAFDAIVSRYRSALVRFCGRILPESRTEDAVQQTFINAHAALLGSDEPVQLKPWLYTIARNSSLNMLRQNGWNYDQIPLDFDGVRRPEQVVEQRIQLQRTVAAVNDLPDRQRDAIVMREFEGRSYEEIALALGANDGAVRQLLNRARGTLRTVATAVMPPPLVMRAVSSLPPSDGRRAAEVLGSLGAAGAMKLGATAVVAGSLVVGAVGAPMVVDHHASHKRAAISAAKPTFKAKSIVAAQTDVHRGQTTTGQTIEDRLHSRTRHHSGHSPTRGREDHGRTGERGDDHSGSGTSSPRSGSDDRTRSGSDDGTRSGSSGGSGSGSGTSGSDDGTSSSGSGSDSGTSGGGSDDAVALSTPTTATSAPTSGSGTSGGGSDDGLTSTSGSGTSGSGSDSSGSGSGSSGSGSHSGSDD